MQRVTFRAMGCDILAVLDSDESSAASVLQTVPDWFAAWEQTFSRFRADSELMQLNQRAGQPVPVSDAMWQVLQIALHAAQWSGGVVTPTLLDALEAAGYDRSFDAVSAAPTQQPASTCARPPDLAHIATDPHTHTVHLPPGMRLDLGGIAKGWAAAQTMQRLEAYAPVLVDAGGDIAISAPQRDGSPWPIGVADPHHPEQQIALLLIGQGGIATSGRDYRRWQRGGAWQHHLIDPRTGNPAQTDLLSVTIVADSAVRAEVAAKVVMILGSGAGLAWLDAQPNMDGLLIGEDGRTLVSRTMHHHLWSAEPPHEILEIA
jgi:thiamine biosynthesis lipoprotein